MDSSQSPHIKPVAKQLITLFKVRDWRLFTVGFLCFLGLSSILASLYYVTQEHLKSSVIQAASRYTEVITEFRTLYTSEVVSRLVPTGVQVTHDYREHEGAIPLPATMSMLLGKRLRTSNNNVDWNLYSDFPFPWRSDGGPQDNFEAQALEQLRQDPSKPFFQFETSNNQQVLRYATADLMRPSCVGCHNNHADTPKKDWKVGDVRGVLAVTLPVAESNNGQLSGINLVFIISAILFVLSGLLLGMLISRQRRNTTVIAAHASELEREVAIRKRREQELESSNSDLLQFAHIASHDLNEPARKVMAFGSLLSEECEHLLGEDAKYYLKTMIDASERMRTLIDGLLGYSRVSKSAISFDNIDLTEIAKNAKSDLALAITDTSGRIEIGDLPTIEANEPQIRQIFQNMMANGLKFHSTENAPVVRVEGKLLNDATCRIRISDNGIGFDLKYQNRIFQIFERLHSRKDYAGSGIGLAVCRKIAERHGGKITVESQIAVGTTFTIILPVKQPRDIHEIPS